MSPVWPPVATAASAALNDAQAIRRAGRDVLSLALIESRNVMLHALAEHETPRRWKQALQAGLFQEHWITGHVQRGRGEGCDAHAPRLAGVEPRAASWADPASPPPPPVAVRAYLNEVLEIALDLLSGAPDDDTSLYFYRRALQQEDRLVERLLPEPAGPRVMQGTAAAMPLWWPAQPDFVMGSAPLAADGGLAGLVPQAERWAHALALPEFEIDARPVSWAQFVEFTEDGGYDRPEIWSEAGWAWRNGASTAGALSNGLAPGTRRAPAAIEQLGAGAVLWRDGEGRLRRVGLMTPVQGVTRHEAEAWCAWAGRRLPMEPEWECAALAGTRRGFVWGEVLEWVAGSARPWPDAGKAPPAELDPIPSTLGRGGRFGVLRGASRTTPARWHHPRGRRFALPGDSGARAGFRSCAP